MTLDKHQIDGIPQITKKTSPSSEFELLLLTAGYDKVGSAPAQGNRLKTWWTHPTFRRVEAIYSPANIANLVKSTMAKIIIFKVNAFIGAGTIAYSCNAEKDFLAYRIY